MRVIAAGPGPKLGRPRLMGMGVVAGILRVRSDGAPIALSGGQRSPIIKSGMTVGRGARDVAPVPYNPRLLRVGRSGGRSSTIQL